MPLPVVWVDNVINPCSVVLNNNEALEILKDARRWISKPRERGEVTSFSKISTTVSADQQKANIARLVHLMAKKDDLKEVLDMKRELSAVQSRVPGGLDASLKKELLSSTLAFQRISKSKKTSGNEGPSTVVDEDSDSEDKIVPSKKSKRIVISDDESDPEVPDVDSDVTKNPEVSDLTEDLQVFSSSMAASVSQLKNEKTIVTFENGQVYVMSSSTAAELDDFNTPTNPMFTDTVVSSFFNEKIPEKSESLDDRWRKSIFSDKPAEEFGNRYIDFLQNEDLEKMEFSKSKDISDVELLKDKKFKEFLLKSEKMDSDVGPFFGLDPVESGPSGPGPDRKILSSIFTDDEIEVLKYNLEKSKTSNIREKHRIQHRVTQPSTSSQEKSENEELRNLIHHEPQIQPKKVTTKIKEISKSDIRRKKYPKYTQNRVVHGAIKYLGGLVSSHRSPESIVKALQLLNKYQLTFVEKLNIINMAPKDLPDILCLLDDLGLRFSKEVLSKFEKDVTSLFPEDSNPDTRIRIKTLSESSVDCRSVPSEKSEDEGPSDRPEPRRKRSRRSSKK